MKRWPAALAALLLLAGGFALGRYVAPDRIVETDRIVTSDREVSSSWRAYVGRTELRERTSTRWQTVTRWTKEGTVEQTAVALADTAREKRAESSAAAAATATREIVRYQERTKLVEGKRPDWTIGAGAGYELDRRELAYVVQVGRRIAGPLWLDLQARKPWAAAAMVRIEF